MLDLFFGNSKQNEKKEEVKKEEVKKEEVKKIINNLQEFTNCVNTHILKDKIINEEEIKEIYEIFKCLKPSSFQEKEENEKLKIKEKEKNEKEIRKQKEKEENIQIISPEKIYVGKIHMIHESIEDNKSYELYSISKQICYTKIQDYINYKISPNAELDRKFA